MQLLLIFILVLPFAFTLEWLSIGLLKWRDDDRSGCKNLKGLTKRQLRYCRRNTDVVTSIAIGAEMAYSECQFQFKKRHWNCTLLDARERERGRGVEAATREAAFLHAISAAGVAYRVTKDCSRGLSDRCGCDHSASSRRPRQNTPSGSSQKGVFEFEGCSDNIQYGIGVSREFVDAAEKARNSSRLATLNLHNNRAGREVLEKSLRRECKCHGMSGSCEAMTCWHSMSPFRNIGEVIKDKFDGASEVLVEEDESKPRIVMKNSHLKRHTNTDLVYMRPSPDYCEMDEERGIIGTRGRQCDPDSAAIDGCQLLCCNRGFERREVVRVEKCKCKFVYCCRVECSNCTHREISHFCH